MSQFRWDEQSEKAAELVAAGELPYSEVAARAGVDRCTVYRWRRTPEFAERVESIREGLRCEAFDRGLALREVRVKALTDRWDRLRRVIESRAGSPKMAAVPGGSTGLVVESVKGIGAGENFEVVREHAVDTGTLAELRAIEKQAAQELGQWSDRHEVAHSGGTTTTVDLGALSTESLLALRAIAGELAGPRPDGGPAGG